MNTRLITNTKMITAGLVFFGSLAGVVSAQESTTTGIVGGSCNGRHSRWASWGGRRCGDWRRRRRRAGAAAGNGRDLRAAAACPTVYCGTAARGRR